MGTMTTQPQPLTNSLLIVFEGIDGSGKTTQLQRAQKVLQAAGWPVYATRNLGGTPIGEALRTVIKSKFERPSTTNLYISAAIQEALIDAIGLERRKGQIILMDRGPLSLAAYEIYGAGLDGDLAWPHVDGGMARLAPELTILYRTDVETALERARHKAEASDYFESQPSKFFEKVAAGYEAAARRYPRHIAVIDANRSVEAIHADTMDAIEQALQQKLATPS